MRSQNKGIPLESDVHTQPSLGDELDGYTELDMGGEALRLARRVLESREIIPWDFCTAVSAILIHSDRIPPRRKAGQACSL